MHGKEINASNSQQQPKTNCDVLQSKDRVTDFAVLQAMHPTVNITLPPMIGQRMIPEISYCIAICFLYMCGDRLYNVMTCPPIASKVTTYGGIEMHYYYYYYYFYLCIYFIIIIIADIQNETTLAKPAFVRMPVTFSVDPCFIYIQSADSEIYLSINTDSLVCKLTNLLFCNFPVPLKLFLLFKQIFFSCNQSCTSCCFHVCKIFQHFLISIFFSTMLYRCFCLLVI